MTRHAPALGLCLALFSAVAVAQPAQSGSPAGRPPRGGFSGGPPGAGAGGPQTLFVSPMGEPFRGPAGQPYPVQAWFARADLNHDGALDRDEFRADADAWFQKLDLDQDGVISSAEVSYYEHVVTPEILRGQQVGALEPVIILAQMGGAMGGMGGGMGGGPGGGMGGSPDDGEPPVEHHAPAGRSMEGAAPYNLLGEPEPVAASDGDLNGRITRAEFRDAADRRFRRLDKAGAGRLTLASLPPTMVQQMGSHGRPGRPDRS